MLSLHAHRRTLVLSLVLAGLLATALVRVAPGPAASRAGCTAEAGWGTLRPAAADEVVALVNDHRTAIGLAPLAVVPALTASSQWKSLHMARFGYFAHDDPAPPVARGAFDRLRDCGYPGAAGENIAYGYRAAAQVVAGWLASPGHRASMENPGYRVTGVGVAVSAAGVLFWTQDFGAQAQARVTAPARRSLQLHDLVAGRPVAGAAFTASVAVRSAPGQPVTDGGVGCRAQVGETTLRVVVNAFRAGRATCGWLVPAEAAGRRLRAAIGVHAPAGVITRSVVRVVS